MIEDDWQPAQEDIEWTEEHFKQMSIGDTWGVADAVLRKDGDTKFSVVKASPNSIMSLQRIGKVCEKIGVELDASQAELIHDSQAAAQAAAEEWTSPKTGVPLVNFDLENAEWINIPAVDPNILDEPLADDMEVWRVLIKHHDEGDIDEVELSPMDYHLLAGDQLFFSWNGMRVIERHEIIVMADTDLLLSKLIENEVFVMPTEYLGEKIPPHLRGLIFTNVITEEE
tara:strand:- start:50047 stop:50727 length:681 start_codon:yes stop_codon:yes gene_type:complete